MDGQSDNHPEPRSEPVAAGLAPPAELAPLDDFGRQSLGALNIEFRAEGDWRAA